jgi:DNA-directed RNA polymerase delta subunit
MAKVSKTEVDRKLREEVFSDLFGHVEEGKVEYERYTKINDRQYGVLLTDANGETRYIRIGAIVAELREDMTAEELMQSEINTYQMKQAEKAEKAKKKEAKIAKDKAEREAKAKAKEEGKEA